MAESRLIGGYPVIGIRPTIDGRRGALKVRESLEDQTMGMAKAAKKLFEENLRYSNGEPVKVVIADTTIGRVAESAACAEKFKKEGVDITLTVTPCWCYGSETMDMDPMTIKGVWGLNATERPGAVYLASVLATHAQKGLPAFGIYGHDVVDADDSEIGEDIKEKLLRFGRAAVAAASMRGKSYLQIGSICMGIGGSIIDVCKEHKKGLFILVKTSNPSSGEFQDQLIDGKPLYELVGEKVAQWGADCMGDEYSYIGAVVGATYPEMGKVLRKVMPKSYILVPGYGAQGGQGKDLVHFFNEDGLGAIVNSSRGIIAAYKQEAYAKFGAENFGDASRAAVEAMVADIQGALEAR